MNQKYRQTARRTADNFTFDSWKKTAKYCESAKTSRRDKEGEAFRSNLCNVFRFKLCQRAIKRNDFYLITET